MGHQRGVAGPFPHLTACALAAVAGLGVPCFGQVVSTWQGATSGSWFDATRWSTDPTVPNFDGVNSYRAVIDATGTAYSISLAQDLRLASLRLDSANATLTQSGGIFDLDGVADLVQGTWRLNGGTIRGGTLAFYGTGRSLAFSNNVANTLDGVTIAGNADFADTFGAVTFHNGLTMSPGASISLSGIGFAAHVVGSQTLSGGTLTLGGLAHNATLSIDDPSALTIAAGTRLEGAGSFTGVAGSSLINAGTISANVASPTFQLGVPNVSNSGTIEATGGGTLNLTGSLNNTGQLRADGGTLVLGGSLSGTGTALATNAGIIQISGSITSQLLSGMQTTSGGIVRLQGSVDNSAWNYDVGSGPSLELLDASISGGQLDFGSGHTIRGTGVVLNDVACSGQANLVPSHAGLPFTLALANGTTLGSSTHFMGLGTLASRDANASVTGDIQFDDRGDLRIGYGSSPGILTLTSGSSLVVAPGRDFNVQSDENLPAVDSTLINHGSITGGGVLSNVAATVWFRPGVFTNGGLVDLADGTSLKLGSGASASDAPTSWSNSGTIRVHNGAVQLGGFFPSSSFSGLDITGSSALIWNGDIDNLGRTLTLGGVGPTWTIKNSFIRGGTVQLLGADPVSFAGNAATDTALGLDAVTLVGDLSLYRPSLSSNSGTYILSVTNGLTLNGTINAGTGTAIRAIESQTWHGGTIELRKNLATNGGSSLINVSTATGQADTVLTIGDDMTIKGGRATITGDSSSRLVNYGHIIADTPGATFALMTSTNHGTYEAINGGALTLAGCDNYGTLKVTDGGVLNFGGSAAYPIRLFPGTTWMRGQGTINLVGVIDNARRTLTLDSSSGYIFGRGGSVSGGTINILGGGGFNLSNLTIGAGTAPLGLGLDGVTLNGDLLQPLSGGLIRIADSSINGTITLQGSNGLLLGLPLNDPTPTTLTGGTVFINPQDSTTVKVLTSQGGHLTLSPTTVIHGGGTSSSHAAEIGATYSNASQQTSITNQGTISADGAGRWLLLTPNTLDNQGVLEATNNSVLQIGSSSNTLNWTSTSGVVRAGAGSRVLMYGSLTTPTFGTVEAVGDGKVEFYAHLDNTGATLDTASLPSSFVVSGTASITGGTIHASSAAPLHIAHSNGNAVFNNVAVIGDLDIGDSGNLSVNGTFSLDGKASLSGDNAALGFGQSNVLSTGSIFFTGTNGSERGVFPGTLLTFGPDFIVHGGYGRLYTNATRGIVNNGLISADVNGRSIRIYQESFTNNGTIEAINGGTIVFVPPGGINGPWTITNSSQIYSGALSPVVFQGPFEQAPAGVLRIGIDDTGESIESGWVVAPSIALGGTLDVRSMVTNLLSEGDSFQILRSPSISGAFDSVWLPTLESPLRWDTQSLYTEGTIRVIPSPGPIALIGLVLCGPLARRRRS